MPEPWARWRASMSSSWNEPGSSRYSMRSRASSLPFSCWRSTERSRAGLQRFFLALVEVVEPLLHRVLHRAPNVRGPPGAGTIAVRPTTSAPAGAWDAPVLPALGSAYASPCRGLEPNRARRAADRVLPAPRRASAAPRRENGRGGRPQADRPRFCRHPVAIRNPMPAERAGRATPRGPRFCRHPVAHPRPTPTERHAGTDGEGGPGRARRADVVVVHPVDALPRRRRPPAGRRRCAR